MIRVLLVDDSPSVRAVVRRFLKRSDDVEVVGEAEDGEQAVQAVLDLSPQVILMDLHMPKVDGYTAIERIMKLRPTPILVLTSRANRNQMQIAFEAMRRGALEVLPKPEDTESWRLLADTLPEVIQAVTELPWAGGLSASTVAQPGAGPPSGAARAGRRPRRRALAEPELVDGLRWVGVGASTGGPAALRELLGAIPRKCPAALLVVQHIAPGFEVGLAHWLNKDLALDVRVALAGERPTAGQVRLAPAGYHMHLDADGIVRLDHDRPPRQAHRPAVDELFESLAAHHADSSAGVLLTGMGQDGAGGLLELRRAGGVTFVQDEASAVIFGMPRVALERGAADIALPPRELARALFPKLVQQAEILGEEP